MITIKIGGSVITDKTKEDTFKTKTMDNISKQLKKANKEIIIIHGAGSFGHILAEKYNLNEGFSNSDQIIGFSEILEKVQTLNTYVLRSLQRNFIPGVSIPPHAILRLDNHLYEKTDLKIFKQYLEKDFVPVTFGDVVLDKKLGFSICSGDLLIYELAKYFKPEKVVFAIDEDGLYSSNPKQDDKAEFIREIDIKGLDNLKTSLDKHSDVTGGMTGKINTIKKIAEKGIDTVLVNGNKPDCLYKTLSGEECKKTIIYGEVK